MYHILESKSCAPPLWFCILDSAKSMWSYALFVDSVGEMGYVVARYANGTVLYYGYDIGSASYTAPMNIQTLLSHNLTAFASASSISVGGNILIWQSSVNGNAYAVGNYSWVYAGTCLLISPRASFWRITPFFPSFRILLPPLLPASASLQSQRQMELGLHNKRLGFVVGVAPTRFFPFRLPSTPTPVLRQTRLPRFGGLSLLQCSLAQLSLSS